MLKIGDKVRCIEDRFILGGTSQRKDDFITKGKSYTVKTHESYGGDNHDKDAIGLIGVARRYFSCRFELAKILNKERIAKRMEELNGTQTI